jgi:hypothetical protein
MTGPIQEAEIAMEIFPNCWRINVNFGLLDDITKQRFTNSQLIENVTITPAGQTLVVIDEQKQAEAMAFLWACFMGTIIFFTQDKYLYELIQQACQINLTALRKIRPNI